MTTQRKDLIMTKDTVIDGDLTAYNITGKNGERYNLTVRGNIDASNIGALDINALNINAYDIDAYDINADDIYACNIDAHDINAHDINAHNINAHDIDVWFILCESIKQKEGSKLLAMNIITKRSGYEQKEMRLKE